MLVARKFAEVFGHAVTDKSPSGKCILLYNLTVSIEKHLFLVSGVTKSYFFTCLSSSFSKFYFTLWMKIKVYSNNSNQL